MTYQIDTPVEFISLNRGRLARKIVSLTVPGAAVLALSMCAGVWMLYLHPEAPGAGSAAPRAENAIEPPVLTPALPPVRAAARQAAAAPSHAAAVRPRATGFAPVLMPLRAARSADADHPYGSLLDPDLLSGAAPLSLAANSPLGTDFAPPEAAPPADAVAEAEEPVPLPVPRRLAENEAEAAPDADASPEAIPLPAPRPAELEPPPRAPRESLREFAQQKRTTTVVAAAHPDDRSFFEKVFGSRQQSSGTALAYANPQDGLFGSPRAAVSAPPGGFDQYTAVYDISAHTVYLPNGQRLEAHSGLGGWMDDPRHVSERMRGATPPNVYALQPREALFHGVQALRLIPIGNGQGYGRTGLLAHTFMLGANGQSNGCVSFRDYQAFLRAYKNGEIRRLAVVARMN